MKIRIGSPECPSGWKSLQASQDCRSRLVQSSLGKTHLCTAISGIGFCFQSWELTWSPQALISGKLRSSMKVNMVFPGGGPYTLRMNRIGERMYRLSTFPFSCRQEPRYSFGISEASLRRRNCCWWWHSPLDSSFLSMSTPKLFSQSPETMTICFFWAA